MLESGTKHFYYDSSSLTLISLLSHKSMQRRGCSTGRAENVTTKHNADLQRKTTEELSERKVD
jgi:hypothetical protein